MRAAPSSVRRLHVADDAQIAALADIPRSALFPRVCSTTVCYRDLGA